MADQELGLKIKTDSDVPQAMGKAQSATVSFAKQTEDIQKKFSTAFKDIFLGFLAPMVIIQNVIGLISDGIAKAKQDAKDGLDLLAKGETTYANAEEKKMANFFKAKKAREDEQKSVEAGKKEMTRRFLKETPEGQAMLQDYERQIARASGEMVAVPAGYAANLKTFQDAALKAFLASPEGKAYQPIFDSQKDQNFKGPEGFSNVVGVGANPVIEAMNAQLEEAQKQTALLEKIASPEGGVPKDFTKDSK